MSHIGIGRLLKAGVKRTVNRNCLALISVLVTLVLFVTSRIFHDILGSAIFRSLNQAFFVLFPLAVTAAAYQQLLDLSEGKSVTPSISESGGKPTLKSNTESMEEIGQITKKLLFAHRVKSPEK